MRTRNQLKRQHSSSAGNHRAESDHGGEDETLATISRDAAGKLLKRVKSWFEKEESGYLCPCDNAANEEEASKVNEKQSVDKVVEDTINAECHDVCSKDNDSSELRLEGCRLDFGSPEKEDEFQDSDWEEGSIPMPLHEKSNREDLINGVTIDFEVSPGSAKRKTVRRATAEEKEVAELMHKAHLLCLIGRGRLVDSACNDTLIQASLLSLLPSDLLKIADSPNLTIAHLAPIVSWFHNNFRVKNSNEEEKPFHLALASALETHEGTPEEVAALSVAFFRALNLTARFVSILDVISLKPDVDKSEFTKARVSKGGQSVFSTSTLMVSGPSCSASAVKLSSCKDEHDSNQNSVRNAGKTKADKLMKQEPKSQDFGATDKPIKTSDLLSSRSENVTKSEGLKRKGDVEFQMQLEMALSATAIESSKNTVESEVVDSPATSSCERIKKNYTEVSPASADGISIAIGSKKVGGPLHWAEVYCSGENLTGKWVHVDAVNAIIDGEQKVEAAAGACRKCLRYVVAFAGNGAKDVTRRYCAKWYKIASKRINSTWWDSVLAPLKELELGTTSGIVNSDKQPPVDEEKIEAVPGADHPNQEGLLDTAPFSGVREEYSEKKTLVSCTRYPFSATRNSIEDMELETRALTEPLPTNQQAYKNHHLYAIERWLKKYEILHPREPVLGFCSGHPVYPRNCVQTLHTKERWLREGLQVKPDEVPAKLLKRSLKHNREQGDEHDEFADSSCEGTVALYGKWQTEKLRLPQAINGFVPKNERGQVDVWSDKCLPPGTVHLRLPRVAPVAKRLDIDYAPAMVGFEFKNGRSFPVFEGIVVCAEFKHAILEAYAEEEERRVAEERKRNEAQALRRWYQLLSSMIIRQRLNDRYGDAASSQASVNLPKLDDKSSTRFSGVEERKKLSQDQVNILEKKYDASPSVPKEDHEHEFILDEQPFDEECPARIKRCHCGFSIQFEEL